MNRSKFGSLSRVRMLHPSFQRLLAAEGATLLLQRLGVRQIDAGRLIELHVLPELGDPRTSPSDLVDLMVYLKEYVLRSASRKDSGAEGGVIFPVTCSGRGRCYGAAFKRKQRRQRRRQGRVHTLVGAIRR